MSGSFDPYSSQPQSGQQPYAPMNLGPRPDIPNHLLKAILATCFCCLPLGIVAIVFAAQVNSKLDAGDYAGATSASQQASMYGNISIWLGIIPVIVGVVLIAVALFVGGVQ
ncbi:MAG TPA: CD225/dispanin family protein [Planctomycetaceae bacterium]|nr:CD225/dispanin family protein [Planctomycetaceae bacterium]